MKSIYGKAKDEYKFSEVILAKLCQYVFDLLIFSCSRMEIFVDLHAFPHSVSHQAALHFPDAVGVAVCKKTAPALTIFIIPHTFWKAVRDDFINLGPLLNVIVVIGQVLLKIEMARLQRLDRVVAQRSVVCGLRLELHLWLKLPKRCCAHISNEVGLVLWSELERMRPQKCLPL